MDLLGFRIPDRVDLFTQEWHDNKWTWHTYCFAHAVIRALEGEQIHVKLTSEIPWSCDDCNSFGAPQAHDLGRLRHGTR